MNIDFEYIVPWNGANDTGRDARLKLERNFNKIKQNFEELPWRVKESIDHQKYIYSDLPIVIDSLTVAGYSVEKFLKFISYEKDSEGNEIPVFDCSVISRKDVIGFGFDDTGGSPVGSEYLYSLKDVNANIQNAPVGSALVKGSDGLWTYGTAGSDLNVYGYSSLDTIFSDADRNNTFNAYTIATKFKEFDSFKAGLGGNYVTVDTSQTVSGQKTFTKLVTLNRTDGVESVLSYAFNGAQKTTMGWHSTLGSYIYNSATGKYLNIRDSGVATFSDQPLLHSGNYNSYAPTLTGAGASGTWAIDIAGKANRMLVNGISNDATYGDFGGIIQDSETGPIYGSWYNKIKILHNNAVGYFTELAQCFSGTEALWHRRMIGGSLSAWRLVLDHENFSGYALPLTGGSLTGNLTISGNQVWHAGNSNLLTVDWVTRNLSVNDYGHFYLRNIWINSFFQIGRYDSTVYYDRACIGVSDGNLHIDSYAGKALHFNYHTTGSAGGYDKAMTLHQNGNVSIGAGDAGYKLYVNGTGHFANTLYAGGISQPIAGFASNIHCSNYVTFTGNYAGIAGLVGDNDYWMIRGGSSGYDTGCLEIATADNGNEPIYVRQYTGVFANVVRTLTLLDENGNTTLPGNLHAGHVTIRVPTNNDYNGAALEIMGIPNTYSPRIGFHQPGLFAGSLAMLDGNNFAFYNQGGSSLANVHGNALFADNWIYTYGNCGWYNQTYGGGIHMQDSIWVRIYNGKAFYVSNTNDASSLVNAGGTDDASISTAGGLHTAKSIVSDSIVYGKVDVIGITGSSSDMRLKCDFKDFNGLQLMKKVGRAFMHHWNDLALSLNPSFDNSQYNISWSAQAMTEVLPQVGIYNLYGGDFLGIKKDRVVPVIWNALLEIDDEVAALKKRVSKLEERLSKYENNQNVANYETI